MLPLKREYQNEPRFNTSDEIKSGSETVSLPKSTSEIAKDIGLTEKIHYKIRL